MFLKPNRTIALLAFAAFAHPLWIRSQPIKAHVVSGMVTMTSSDTVLHSAEANRLTLVSKGAAIRSVVADWSRVVENRAETPVGGLVDSLTVQTDAAGATYVEVIPPMLGHVHLTLQVAFADGGVERQKLEFKVAPSQQHPDKLLVTTPGASRQGVATVAIDVGQHPTIPLEAVAVHKTTGMSVTLGPADVIYKLIAAPGGPAPVRLDPAAGTVTAVHLGNALVETTYDGVSTLTCVNVVKDIRAGGHERCTELLPAGRSLPPEPWDDVTFKPPVVKTVTR